MRILAFIGALAIVTGVLAGGYFLGGFYSVAASVSDAGPVVWALTRVRTHRSIATLVGSHRLRSMMQPYCAMALGILQRTVAFTVMARPAPSGRNSQRASTPKRPI